MTEVVKALVTKYLGINKQLANYSQQLKLTILDIKKALEENVITDQNLKELFLTTIIDDHYPGTKLLLKEDLDENSPTLSKYSSDLLKKVKSQWINIIQNERYTHMKINIWQTIFPEILDGNNVSILLFYYYFNIYLYIFNAHSYRILEKLRYSIL